jgi:hypothetical protein
MNTDQFIATLNESGLLADACEHLDKCMSETKKTGRGSVVVLRIAVKIEKESGDTIAVAKVSAKWPKCATRAEEIKGEGWEIARAENEVEGQTRIEEVVEKFTETMNKNGAKLVLP